MTKRFNKLLRPQDNLWVADVIFLTIPLLMIASLFYSSLFPASLVMSTRGQAL